ncbi:MAG: exosortase/archaeosortase family protein [Verrucomicrobia bacterium]|nr:exosortase/archaeosortase family protein [Verrucomicrobiota bacterium]
MISNTPATWLPLIGVAALWTPAMVAASYVWGHGEYYDYGWFVPPAALWLLVRRWQALDGPVRGLPTRTVLASAALLLPWILVLRVLGYADPAWRLPMSLLGVTAAVVSHGLIAATRSARASAGFAWITLLCMSALPWPSMAETQIVHHLTQGVVAAVAEVFQMFGKPVEVMGDRLRLHDLTVEVTDGCSGVRSFQSFVMATWFFAELQRLPVARALTLLVCACGVAFAVNMARTYALAHIRFAHGPQAFDRAHDALGLLAFFVSAWFFYVFSGWLSAKARRTVVKTVQRQ